MNKFIFTTKWKEALFFSIPLLLLIPTFLIIFPGDFYYLNLLQSIAVYGLFLYPIIGFFLLIFKHYSGFLTTCVCMILILFLVGPYLSFRQIPFKKNENSISICQTNLLKFNTIRGKVLDEIFINNPDIISFQEVDTDWSFRIIDSLQNNYPYAVNLPHDEDAYGLLLLSKFPIVSHEVIHFKKYPILKATVVIKEDSLSVYAAHTPSPITKERFHERNEMIQKISQVIDQNNIENAIVIGDFNTVPWSKNIKKFQVQNSLKDSRKNYTGTWPSWLPGIKIPIDYILIGQNIQCHHLEVMQKTTSDHLGIIGHYSIKNKQSLNTLSDNSKKE